MRIFLGLSAISWLPYGVFCSFGAEQEAQRGYSAVDWKALSGKGKILSQIDAGPPSQVTEIMEF